MRMRWVKEVAGTGNSRSEGRAVSSAPVQAGTNTHQAKLARQAFNPGHRRTRASRVSRVGAGLVAPFTRNMGSVTGHPVSTPTSSTSCQLIQKPLHMPCTLNKFSPDHN